MLAPFGLAGTLTGHVYKNMDAETSRMMDEWSHFYPVVNSNGPNELSPAVEVIVGKSYCFSSFIFVESKIYLNLYLLFFYFAIIYIIQ
jgi:hypothetical protein